LKTSPLQIVYRPREDATAEGEVSCLSEIYKFILFGSQTSSHTSKGGLNDLIKDSTEECTTRSDQKGKDSADVHRYGL
jgi:hypothetical protein